MMKWTENYCWIYCRTINANVMPEMHVMHHNLHVSEFSFSRLYNNKAINIYDTCPSNADLTKIYMTVMIKTIKSTILPFLPLLCRLPLPTVIQNP